MTEKDKLTIYDPAEDLSNDEAIAIFMAEAFETGDAGYIARTTLSFVQRKGKCDPEVDTRGHARTWRGNDREASNSLLIQH